jgi:hypothetical protein
MHTEGCKTNGETKDKGLIPIDSYDTVSPVNSDLDNIGSRSSEMTSEKHPMRDEETIEDCLQSIPTEGTSSDTSREVIGHPISSPVLTTFFFNTSSFPRPSLLHSSQGFIFVLRSTWLYTRNVTAFNKTSSNWIVMVSKVVYAHVVYCPRTIVTEKNIKIHKY